MMSEPELPLICGEVEETNLYQNSSDIIFRVHNTFGTEDGRFMLAINLNSISMLEIKTGKMWYRFN